MIRLYKSGLFRYSTHHPSVAIDDLRRSNEAILHAEQAVDIARYSLESDHPCDKVIEQYKSINSL